MSRPPIATAVSLVAIFFGAMALLSSIGYAFAVLVSMGELALSSDWLVAAPLVAGLALVVGGVLLLRGSHHGRRCLEVALWAIGAGMIVWALFGAPRGSIEAQIVGLLTLVPIGALLVGLNRPSLKRYSR